MANLTDWLKSPADKSQAKSRPLNSHEIKAWDKMFEYRVQNGYSSKDAAKDADDYIAALRRR